MKLNKNWSRWALVLSLGIVGFAFWLLPDEQGVYPGPLGNLLGQVFPERITPELLAERYANQGLSILLIPGHDNEYSGAGFEGVREADINLELATKLENFLAADGAFRVSNARAFPDGDYHVTFRDYFANQRSEIENFRLTLRQNFADLIAVGAVTERQAMNHNFAKPEVSLRLYGLNKWANENQVDLTLHIHFNDYAGRPWRQAGRYSGLSVYVPEGQYPNARTSRRLGEAVFNQLTKFVSPSNMPLETDGVIDDQELIAIGAHASRDGAAILVEYGYIYEPPLRSSEIRSAYLEELAWQTYLGIKNYFDPEAALALVHTRLWPHRFAQEFLTEGLRSSRDVLALQKALALEGLYPPPGSNLMACPINGNFGPCVRAAVMMFQNRYSADILQSAELVTPTGVAGPLTLKKINELYGG